MASIIKTSINLDQIDNVKVVWTNGNNVAVPPRDDAQGNGGFQAAGQPQKVEDDLPF